MAKNKDYRDVLTTPFETGIRNFTSIAKFYLYYAPDIDSAQTPGILDDTHSDAILNEMLSTTGMKTLSRILQRIQVNAWASSELSEYQLDFEKSRLLCDRNSNETKLHALLRHIRNALAHGYIYVWRKKAGDFVFLVDFDSKKHKPTAKIMVSMPILIKWKEILEAPLGELS